MAKLNRDEQLYSKLKDILQKYRIDYSSEGTLADILYYKIDDYSDLKGKAFNLLYDVNGNEKSVNSEMISDLYQLKEEAYERRISEVRQKLSEVGLENFQYSYDLAKQRARKTDHKTKYSKVSAEVYYNELIRQLSDLPYGSERVRRKTLHDGKTLEGLFVKVPAVLEQLREQFSNLTGQEYQVPKTTFKREFVTLREEIGEQLAKEAGISKEIAGLDKHYQYRFLTDRWNNALEKNKGNTPVLRDFADKQLQNLRSDVAVLNSYQQLVITLKENGIITSDSGITPLEHLSVRDKIKVYRQQLSGILKKNLDQVVNLVGSHSPAYLDFVESQKKDNPTLYERTVKELSKDLNFSDTKKDNFVNRKVPLSSWQQIADDVRARRSAEKERLFNGERTSQSAFSEAWKSKGWVRRLVDYREVQKRDGTTVKIPNGVTKFKDSYYRNGIDDGALASAREQEKSRLLGTETSFEDFNRGYKSSGEVRSLFPRTAVTDTNNNPVTSNGKLVKKPEGLTRFNGFWYRDGVDQDKLLKDYNDIVKDSFDKIQAAKDKISDIKKRRIDRLDADIKKQEATGHDVTRKKKLLDKLQQRLKDFTERKYDYQDIGSFDRRASAVKAAAEELSVKASILEQDPAFNFNGVLKDVKREGRLAALKDAKKPLNDDISDVKTYQQQYNEKGFSIPPWLANRSVHDQLEWYRKADDLMSGISSKDRNTFVSWMSGQKYGALLTQLPVGYLQRINGKVFRSVEDADIIADLNRKKEVRKQKEERILAGPAAREKSQQLGAFGTLLNSKVSVNGTALNKVSSLASDFSSEKYAALSYDEKKLFDRNFGKPVKEGNIYYRSIYDMPSDVWKRSEKAAGYDVPRSRNGVMPADSDIRVAEEEAFQKKLTEDLAARTWEPVKVAKSDKPSVPAPTEEPKAVTEEKIVQQETKSNLRKMLSSANKTVRRNSIGTMGLLSALTLFNSAMAGPSDEAVAHKRKVEEERRMKMYGY